MGKTLREATTTTSSKRQVKGKLGHLVQIRVCRLM